MPDPIAIRSSPSTQELAVFAIKTKGDADLVAFGVPFVVNADLVERLRTDAPLNKPDLSLLYGVGAKGYTDYPAFKSAAAA